MHHHKIQWVIGLVILVAAFYAGISIYAAQRPQATPKISESVIKQSYRQWQREYLSGNQEKFVLTAGSEQEQTLSEAQGYGMLITAMAATHGLSTHRTFDQLTKYYLAHRISEQNPLMAWRQKSDHGQMKSSAAEQTSSATDGDLDIAYALILADQTWGNQGKYHYRHLATRLIRAIKKYEISPITKLPRVGNWATTNATDKLVRTSDLMTAYFRKFARYMQDSSWNQVAENSQEILQRLSEQRSTGLMADFITVSDWDLKLGTVKAKQVSTVTDGEFGFNACRVPMRTAYDYQISRSPVSKAVTEKFLNFFEHQSKISAGYTLTGQPLAKYENQAFTMPIVYASYVTHNDHLLKRYEPLLKGLPNSNDYYPATLHMLVLLMSANIGKG